jgi:hypothetical protein
MGQTCVRNNNGIIIGALIVIVLVLAFVVYQQEANRPKTPGQEIVQGVGQAIQNAGDSIQRASGK